MRINLGLLATLFLCASITAQDPAKNQAPPPGQFEVGVFTFFDFGPPFNYYQLYLVRSLATGTKVERIILTPSGFRCVSTAKIEAASATLPESVTELLGSKNPCAIPEKELRREIKRCKKCLVFSGSKVTMQVQCGATTRLIRSDVLDRDMFDPAAHTPGNTLWTMALLGKIDKPPGSGAMEKPMFSDDTSPTAQTEMLGEIESEVIRDVDHGKYDALFPGNSEKLGDLYRETLRPSPLHPSATLKFELPVKPALVIEPEYPPLAKATHTEGDVTFTFEIDPSGVPAGINIIIGHPLLNAAVKDAIAKWRFDASAAGQKIQATIQFALNCSR